MTDAQVEMDVEETHGRRLRGQFTISCAKPYLSRTFGFEVVESSSKPNAWEKAKIFESGKTLFELSGHLDVSTLRGQCSKLQTIALWSLGLIYLRSRGGIDGLSPANVTKFRIPDDDLLDFVASCTEPS